MTLTQLDHVLQAYRAGSFSRAARICGVTQAALSNSVAKLEEELGERIFSRTTRRVSLSPFGQNLMPHIEQVLDGRDALVHAAKAVHTPKTTVIGYSPLIPSHILTRIVRDIRDAQFGPEIRLIEENLSELLQRLGEHTVDIALLPDAEYASSLRSSPIWEDALYYVPRRSAEAKLDSIELQTLAAETFVMVPDRCGLARTTRQLFASAGVKLQTYAGEAMGYHVLEEWAALDLGSAILPRSRLTNEARAVPVMRGRESPRSSLTVSCGIKNTSGASNWRLFSNRTSRAAQRGLRQYDRKRASAMFRIVGRSDPTRPPTEIQRKVSTNPNKALWEKGDFTRIAESMRQSGDALVRTLGITTGMKVLDFGCGDGTTALPEAKLGADVLGVDIAKNLVEAGNRRAREAGLKNCRFQEGDATSLRELEDGRFDLVVSIFGAMFAPKPFDVAKEMVRVTRPGGRVVMGNWIPNDPTLVAQILSISAAYTPPPPEGFISPMTWGVESNVRERFTSAGVQESNIACVKDSYTFDFRGLPSALVAEFRKYYGPTMNAFAAAEKAGRESELAKDLEHLFTSQNKSPNDDQTSIPATFLRVTVTR